MHSTFYKLYTCTAKNNLEHTNTLVKMTGKVCHIDKNVCYYINKNRIYASQITNDILLCGFLFSSATNSSVKHFQVERITQIWYDYFIVSIGYYQMLLWQVVGDKYLISSKLTLMSNSIVNGEQCFLVKYIILTS